MNSLILVVEPNAKVRGSLAAILDGAGLESTALATHEEALEWLAKNTPSLVVIGMNGPDSDGYGVLDYLRAQRAHDGTPVVVVIDEQDDEEVERVFAAGADDCVSQPIRPAEFMARIRGQLRVRGYVERLNKRERDQESVLQLTQALASSLGIADILFTVVKRVADVAEVDRCSIVLVGERHERGFVVATSDDETVRNLQLDLHKYPEIRQVLTTGKALVIRDASRHPLLEAVRHHEAGLDFISIALVPILHDAEPMGVIFLRARRVAAFFDYEMSLVHTVANATAVALRNARILQSLRDQTEQSTHARVEAERRVQLFQRYADFFESAADGMIVIDRSGGVLFANARSREITRHSETALMNLTFPQLLTESSQVRAKRLLSGFGEGVYPRGVDLELEAEDSERIIINVSFSSVLHEDNAVLCTFRDVTQERHLAKELTRTKEFLERVIDSSVDAIVAADLRGQVLVYNRAASRIFGHQQSDVIGKLRVDGLYPEGVARQVMRAIKDPDLGGYGKLEDYRVDMLDAKGAAVPVKLSAALVTEGRRAIATVGVFTDIRDKLKMTKELEKAQEALRERERQALVAELAGATAHELNQPLMIIVGYAEMLQRQLAHNDRLRAHADIIVEESERMAKIVRQVGQITKYETKSYVGGAKILDLEKAIEPGKKDEEAPG